jgi:hypothetical protein
MTFSRDVAAKVAAQRFKQADPGKSIRSAFASVAMSAVLVVSAFSLSGVLHWVLLAWAIWRVSVLAWGTFLLQPFRDEMDERLAILLPAQLAALRNPKPHSMRVSR